MPRYAPPPSGPATMATLAFYYRQGKSMLASALASFPSSHPIEALLKQQRSGGPLEPASLPVYRAVLIRIVKVLLRQEGQPETFDKVWTELDDTLTARKQKADKDSDRTASGKKRKVKNATEQEASALFAELKRHSLKSKNMNAVLATLFCLVAGHGGFRPVELMGSERSGETLVLRNAKRQKGQSPTRMQYVGELHKDVLIGMDLLTSLIDHDMSRRQFRAWEKTIAEQMRRACKRINIRVLAPYSFRHIAIATWSASGLSPEEIARLCGHISIRTAHTHYARAAAGHKRKAVARAVMAETSEHETVEARAGEVPKAAIQGSETASIFVVESMPMPGPMPRKGPAPLSHDAVKIAFARYEGDVDIKIIARRLREVPHIHNAELEEGDDIRLDIKGET
jgi:integrase